MDGTAERMRRAKGRLNRVARGGKEHGQLVLRWMIVGRMWC